MGPSTIKNIGKVGRTAWSEFRTSRATERQWYPTRRDFAVRVYDRILRKLHWAPLPARKKVVRTQFAGDRTPFYVRLGSSDLQLNQTIVYRGEYDPLWTRDLGPVRQIVDLGANAGLTIRMWRQHFPAARVIAVEPDAGNAEMCRLNGKPQTPDEGPVDVIVACVDGKPGRVMLEIGGAEHQFKIADSAAAGAKTIAVQALTVAQVLEGGQANAVIDLLKCDIQGAEKAVFADCAGWVKRVRNMVVELHDDYTPELFLADLTRAGWRWQHLIQHKTDDLWVMFLWGDDANLAAPAAGPFPTA